MRQLVRKMGYSCTVHGFRSTFTDWAGDTTNYRLETIKACISHHVGDATTLAYRRRTALEKRRVIMQEWADYCGGMRAPA
jgi:integrase